MFNSQVYSVRDHSMVFRAYRYLILISRACCRLSICFPSISPLVVCFLAPLVGYIFSRTYSWFMFSRACNGFIFSRAGFWSPALVVYYPALAAGYMFYRTYSRLHIFPRLLAVLCSPALAASCIFSRACSLIHVFSRS